MTRDRRKSPLKAGGDPHPAWQGETKGSDITTGNPAGGDEGGRSTTSDRAEPQGVVEGEAKQAEEQPVDQGEQQETAAAEMAPEPSSGSGTALPAPVTRNPRRLRVVGKVSDDDMVSFNCKMSRGLRRQVRHFAADAEVDIQDVVAAALAEYLSARGVAVPAFELRQPG
jgi:hypothetical protein